MKQLLKKVLTDKTVRDLTILQALTLAVVVMGDPWSGSSQA